MQRLYESDKVSVKSTLKNKLLTPKSFKKQFFEEIKDDILGKDYELSLVLIGKKRSKSLNARYRKIEKPTDILSFSVSPLSGEIFICPEIAKKKAPTFDMNFENYLLFLVIHGSLHLKGLEHGSKMEKYELSHYSRYRRRHL